MFVKVLKLIMLSFALNIALVPWGTSLTRWSGYATILLSYFLPFIEFRTDFRIELRGETKYTFFICVVLIASIAISLPAARINVDYFRDVLAFACMYCAMSVPEHTFSKRDLNCFFAINKLLSLVYIAYTFAPVSFTYSVVDEWGNTQFTLGMGNPNGTALNIMFSIALLVIEVAQEKKTVRKLFGLCLIAALMYDVVLLQSRTVMLCSILLILTIWLKRMPLKIWFVDMVMLIPFAFIVFQIWVGDKGDVMIMGKTIASGRQNHYLEYFDLIKQEPWKYIFGNIGKFRLENAHNAPFAILMSLGILGLGGYYAFWRTMLRNSILNHSRTYVQNVATIALLVYMVYSSTEAGPMIGMILYSSPLLILCRLAKDTFV